MSDKITLDFENNSIEFDTNEQQGVEICPDLAERKGAILKAMGYEQTPIADIMRELSQSLHDIGMNFGFSEKGEIVQTTPSPNGQECAFNGNSLEFECRCDECEHYLTCFEKQAD